MALLGNAAVAGPFLLTAGHCTSGATGGRVWFQADARSLPDYPDGLPLPTTSVAFAAMATHPLFTDNAFFLHDVGIVKLSQPVALAEYGVLPAANLLDTFKKKDVTFTSVGYGLQKSFPDAAAWKDVALRIRMLATPNSSRSTCRARSATSRCCCRTTLTPEGRASATPAARTSSAAPI
jgi:hypothetical protein